MVVRQSDSGRKVEIGIWHLFVFALSRILKKRGKRRKTKKTRENLGFFDRHLLRPEHLEATSGFGPENNGFADRGLTTWLCRLKTNAPVEWERIWSGLRGSNPPPQPWQGCALPNELNPHMRQNFPPLVPPVGIEPTTRGFSVLCSTN